MQMTLSDLRTAALEWLDDPHGMTFAPNGDYSRLDQLLNEAYDELVLEIDAIPTPWSIETDSASAVRATISLVSTQREYAVDVAMRKVATVTEPADSADQTQEPVLITPYTMRNDRNAVGVYVFRSGNTGTWYLGLCRMPPAWTSLIVHGLPPVTRLSAAADVPYLVPDAFHTALVRRAALLGKIQENKEYRPLTMLWGEDLIKLRGTLGSQVQSFGARRFSGRA